MNSILALSGKCSEGRFLTPCLHGQQYTVSRETNPYGLSGPVLVGYYLLS